MPARFVSFPVSIHQVCPGDPKALITLEPYFARPYFDVVWHPVTVNNGQQNHYNDREL